MAKARSVASIPEAKLAASAGSFSRNRVEYIGIATYQDIAPPKKTSTAMLSPTMKPTLISAGDRLMPT